MGLGTLPRHERLLLKDPWSLGMGSSSGSGSLPVGAGSAWHWHGVTAAWVVGGFTVIAGHGARWPCHLCVARNFANAGFMDGGVHVQGWRVMMSERGVDDRSLGNFLLTSCSHCWGGSSGEA